MRQNFSQSRLTIYDQQKINPKYQQNSQMNLFQSSVIKISSNTIQNMNRSKSFNNIPKYCAQTNLHLSPQEIQIKKSDQFINVQSQTIQYNQQFINESQSSNKIYLLKQQFNNLENAFGNNQILKRLSTNYRQLLQQISDEYQTQINKLTFQMNQHENDLRDLIKYNEQIMLLLKSDDKRELQKQNDLQKIIENLKRENQDLRAQNEDLDAKQKNQILQYNQIQENLNQKSTLEEQVEQYKQQILSQICFYEKKIETQNQSHSIELKIKYEKHHEDKINNCQEQQQLNNIIDIQKKQIIQIQETQKVLQEQNQRLQGSNNVLWELNLIKQAQTIIDQENKMILNFEKDDLLSYNTELNQKDNQIYKNLQYGLNEQDQKIGVLQSQIHTLKTFYSESQQTQKNQFESPIIDELIKADLVRKYQALCDQYKMQKTRLNILKEKLDLQNKKLSDRFHYDKIINELKKDIFQIHDEKKQILDEITLKKEIITNLSTKVATQEFEISDFKIVILEQEQKHTREIKQSNLKSQQRCDLFQKKIDNNRNQIEKYLQIHKQQNQEILQLKQNQRNSKVIIMNLQNSIKKITQNQSSENSDQKKTENECDLKSLIVQIDEFLVEDVQSDKNKIRINEIQTFKEDVIIEQQNTSEIYQLDNISHNFYEKEQDHYDEQFKSKFSNQNKKQVETYYKMLKNSEHSLQQRHQLQEKIITKNDIEQFSKQKTLFDKIIRKDDQELQNN